MCIRIPYCIFILLLLFSCKNKNKSKVININQLDLCDSFKRLDIALPEPTPGYWLFEHKEKGQTFDQYINYSPVTPFKNKTKIYLLPIGEFTEMQTKVIGYTADYLQIYFNLTVKTLNPISDNVIPEDKRRMREDGHEQLLTTYILNKILKKNIPSDAIVLMAITAKDLYPKDSWNFVFGQASLKERVGVSSIYWYSEEPLDSLNYSICLERLIKTSTHEIGHMFSIRHCTNAVCLMNGSNGLFESDEKPNSLCSVCLKKLYWNLGFDIKNRFLQSKLFFDKHHLHKDAELMQQHLNIIR